MAQFIFYTAPYCAACLRVKPQLQKWATSKTGRSYTEKDVEQNPQWRDEMTQLGFPFLPTLAVYQQKRLVKSYAGFGEIEKALMNGELDRLDGNDGNGDQDGNDDNNSDDQQQTDGGYIWVGALSLILLLLFNK
ncbi:MAG: glutaredoxin domain-containing protein [Bacteroidota bacterium]